MSEARIAALVAEVDRELPLRVSTAAGWAPRAAGRMETFLADHAVCEQAAALTALNLVTHYPEDEELVERMTALAIEEATHLRKVAGLLRDRGHSPARRRVNRYAATLNGRIDKRDPRWSKVDRLLVGALIEARSCERFTRMLAHLGSSDPEVAELLIELGPAEKRHWELFHRLAGRGVEPDAFAERWEGWLAFESELQRTLGDEATVHG